MIQKDCKFITDKCDRCTALKALYCALEDKPCKFYKPRKKSTVLTDFLNAREDDKQ